MHFLKSCMNSHRALDRHTRLLIVFSVFLAPLPSSALQEATPVTANGPAESQIQAGIALLKHNDAAAAKLRFSEALRSDPRSTDALVWRGIAENQLQQFSSAKQDFDSALAIDPSLLDARYNLALSLIRLGESDRALDDLRMVVSAQPGMLEPEYNLAILLEQKHQLDEAIDHLEAAHRSHPDDIPVLEHLLIDLDATGRNEEAQPLFNFLVSSSTAESRKSAGTALLQAGDYAGASVLFESVLRESPVSHEVKRLLAWAYIGMHRNAEAIDLLKADAVTDGSGESAYLLGVAYEASGSIEDARNAYASAFRFDPHNGRAAYHLGMIASSRPGQLNSALHYLREAVSLEPENPSYALALGKCLLEQNNPSEALRVLHRLQVQGPEAGEKDLLLGIAEIVLRGPSSAAPALERSVVEDPSLALAQNILGFCYLNQGATGKAAAAYGKASDLKPESRIFAHSAAVAFDRANDPERAHFYAQRAAALPDANGEDHFLLGRLLAKAGKPQEAVAELNQAIASNPDSQEAYYILARCYSQMGNDTQANYWVSKLKELQKTNADSGTTMHPVSTPLTSSALFQGAPDSK